MHRKMLFAEEARDAVRRGVSLVARAARTTLGPKGHHVMLQQSNGAVLVTKDGVTVVKQIELDDPFENVGAQLLQQVADKTSERAGDGTTTATILAESIFIEGLKAVAAGINPVELQRGIDAAVADIVAKISEMAVPATQRRWLQAVPTVASNGDVQIGEMLADIFSIIGPDGVVTVEDGKTATTEVHWIEGMQLDRGYLSPYFINNAPAAQCVLENAAVLICDEKLSSLPQILPVLEAVAQAKRPLLIVADDVEGEALAALVVNASRGVLSACAIKSPGFGEARIDLLEDLSAFTGSTPCFTSMGRRLDQIQLSELGRVSRVVVERESTAIVGASASKTQLQARIAQLDALWASTENGTEGLRLEKRLAQLKGRIADIRVGATTESELQEKKARIDDALHATRAALQEGVVPGGGVALLRASLSLEVPRGNADWQLGYQILLRSCAAPAIAIANNAGRVGTAVIRKIAEGERDFGYNAASDRFGPLLRDGVVDSAKVVRLALQTAASLAVTLLTSGAVIARSEP